MQLLANWLPAGYPRQFRLLVGGNLLTTTGFAMVFPFLTLYLNTRLGVPMDRIGLVFIGNAAAGLIAQTLAGPIADQFGRKPVMLSGLFAQSCVAVGFTQARRFEEFALLFLLWGFFGTVFNPAASAMVVDLVGEEKRAEAFGLMRIANNLGFCIGPTIGGLLAVQSYSLLFIATALFQFSYLVALLLFAKETLPPRAKAAEIRPWNGVYGPLLRDRAFLTLLAASLLTTLVYAQLGTTMPVYLRQQMGILESSYGLLMALNGGLIVLFQPAATRLVQRRNRVNVLALGTLCYAVGIGSIGWWQELPQFALSIVIVTVGEMAIAPVASALVADLSPVRMRARYMAAFGLTWTLGFGFGPSLGGLATERLGPSSVWNLAMLGGCLAALAYLPLHRQPVARRQGG